MVRVGDTVRRPAGPNTPFVGRLLAHLHAVGFEEAPRFLGLDERGRETLEFLPGDVPSDCRGIVWSDAQLRASARLLRRFHDATAGGALAGHAEVVCHNDFGPWNLVWVDDLPRGIIDFDNAAPGSRVDDLGYAVWKHLNVGLLGLPAREQLRRLEVMATAYGLSADDVLLAAMTAWQAPVGGG